MPPAALSTASAAIGVGIGVTLVKYGKIILDAAPLNAVKNVTDNIGTFVGDTLDYAKRIRIDVDPSMLGMNFGNIRIRLAQKSTFELPKTWRSAKGITGNFSDGKHSFRIDTHNLSPGERFHIHVYDVRGKEIAVIQGRGTNGIWRESHQNHTLLKPSQVSNALRTDIRRLVRNAFNHI